MTNFNSIRSNNYSHIDDTPLFNSRETDGRFIRVVFHEQFDAFVEMLTSKSTIDITEVFYDDGPHRCIVIGNTPTLQGYPSRTAIIHTPKDGWVIGGISASGMCNVAFPLSEVRAESSKNILEVLQRMIG